MNLSNEALEKTTDIININNIIKNIQTKLKETAYADIKVTLYNLKKDIVMIIN